MVRLLTIQPLADADLRKRIAIAFATRPRIAWHSIDASVENGFVTLRGNVPSVYDRQLIVAVTRHVAGVRGIDDQLVLVEAKTESPQTTHSIATPPVTTEHTLPKKRLFRHFLWHGAATLTLATFVFVGATGCGSGDGDRIAVYPATGAIKFRGQPVPGAFVSLHRKDGADIDVPHPTATVGADGTFSLSTYAGQDGAPEGDYVLTVQWYKPIRREGEIVGGPNALPPKYASANTSDIVVKIAAEPNNLAPIQIR